MTGLADIFNAVTDFQNYIEFLRSTWIYAFFTRFFAEAVKWAILESLKFKIMMITFSWDIAKELLASLQLSERLHSYFSGLNSDMLVFINFLKIPDAINIILSAHLTRFIMRFAGF
jgi:hypothetical protein